MAANKKGLVIVESPAKARKIAGFLGNDYIVKASMGHVRDLPARAAEIPAAVKKEPWSNLGVNVENEFDPLYVVPADKKKLVKELKDALKSVNELILATDEDREGESIGWHLVQLLKPKVPITRMVFSEITKPAILDAIKHTRQLDENLVKAQETRRVVDRLYGYTLSPLLWKKIARGLSAGRVQSVAVKVLVARELERMKFHSGTFWDLKVRLATEQNEEFEATLHTVDNVRIATGKDFDESTGRLREGADVLLLDEKQAGDLQAKLDSADWNVTSIDVRRQTRNPYPPFTTSTLQQESNRKLNMTARQTMQVAQRLYEEGHITYMRTDSVHLSNEAIEAARGKVEGLYGKDYLSDGPRRFKTKSQGAQEAHEAIRPSGTEMKTAEEIGLRGQELRLYQMIWKRTMATQMAEAQLRFDTVTIKSDNAEFRASGRTVEFPGFFRAYVEGSDDPEAAIEDQDSSLPAMKEDDKLNCRELTAVSHETKPPARFTEATLVRTLEAEGVGRPSTYASIIGTIQDRGYVRKNGSQLVPTFTALAVTRLLEDHFPRLVDLGFTAGMEQSLDDIATGSADRLPYLRNFYSGSDGLDEQVKEKEAGIDPREACTLKLDGFQSDVRVGRYGPYFQRELADGETISASIPDSIAPADISNEMADKLIEDKKRGPLSLGMHPEEGLPIFLRNGPFGPYLQLGEVTEEVEKPKRCSIPKCFDQEHLDLATAIRLLELPRRIGHHPVTKKVVNAGIGRFGPYVTHNKIFASFDKNTHTIEFNGQTFNVLNVTMDAAVQMLSNRKPSAAPEPIRELGEHPELGGMVAIFDGKYGPYVKHGKVNATVGKDRDPQSLTLEQACDLIAERAAKKGIKQTKKKSAKKTTAKKKATKKKAAGKKAAKKSAKKKSAKSTTKMEKVDEADSES